MTVEWEYPRTVALLRQWAENRAQMRAAMDVHERFYGVPVGPPSPRTKPFLGLQAIIDDLDQG